jgi:hypothetical protein
MCCLIVLIISLPLEVSMAFFLREYCVKRPRLEQIGLDPIRWLGSMSRDDQKIGKMMVSDDETPADQLSALGTLFRLFGVKYGYEMQRKSIVIVKNVKTRMSKRDSTTAMKMKMVDRDRAEVYSLSKLALAELLSVEEEADAVLEGVREFMVGDLEAGILPWDQTDTRGGSDRREARMRAIIHFLGVYRDGAPAPLGIFAQLYWGSFRNRLEYKLRIARESSAHLIDSLPFYDSEPKLKDVVLMQSFVVEQFTAHKRYALSSLMVNCAVIIPPDPIDAIPWILGWFLQFAVIGFYMYWMFAWGVYNGGDTVAAWGIMFAINVLQDLVRTSALVFVLFFTPSLIVPFRPHRYHSF